ncbi:MAG TPA: cysteine--tRNA ligase [Spongiibacteraceae bacterium]|jgi:cysteinyl-tRNA synthetase|nr:cysteine--tRNA ligase [Spongiibacteraceae bacterium]HUH36503.1 cysteine--tRNA ligase [Spongiibacteraceae bacterium]
MSLQIYNTLARKKQVFTPLQGRTVRMYVCGMTVYDYCHLGHARVLVAFDVVTRYLRASGYDVTYVRNITDVDDKIIRRAAENGETPMALTARFIDAMHEDERRLGVLPPDHEPRATAHIDAIVAMIETLIDKGYAYRAANGDVYYRVSRFEGYGKLSGKNPDELLAGARIEVGEQKEDPRDFALWKAAESGELTWPSPWSQGRPGWHIECSAMSKGCLGETFDIHGGGPDLRFPHHENEIAQSEAANGKPFVNYWMHAGAVRVDGEKMSKSLGNFFTIREILDNYHPEVVRFLLIASHYRSAINYSEDSLKDARQKLDRLYHALKDHADVPALTGAELQASAAGAAFRAAMDDDFNTPEALAVLFDLVRRIHSADDETTAAQGAATLKGLGAVLGILQGDPRAYLQAGSAEGPDAEAIEAQIAARLQARKDKNFALADQIRDTLQAQGIVLEDSREGTTWRRE